MVASAVTVGGLLKSRPEALGLPLELLGGARGLDRTIASPHIQKTGLALTGFDAYIRPHRILVFGESEVRYLEALPASHRFETLALVFRHDIPCVLITGGWEAPVELVLASEQFDMPLLRTSVQTPQAIAKIGAILDDRLATREIMHGVLVDILGLGVLIIGESGIGKSECALDLVVRGHRLVADDTVEMRRRGEQDIIGACPELTRHHMEVRGLGLINIRDLFGVASTRLSKRIELVVQLERWDPMREYDRLGLDDNLFELLGMKVPLIQMPVAPGRSLAILVEVAARNQLLRSRGLNAARALVSRLDERLRASDAESDRETEVEEDLEPGGRE